MNSKPQKVVTFGEVMMRLSTLSTERFTQAKKFEINYAGAEANVAVSLSNFGISTVHVTRFPDNDLGRAAMQTLRQYGVDTQHVLYGNERMGTYFLEAGSMHRSPRIIYDRFDSAFSRIKKGDVDWENILKDATWFHYTGITSAISQGAADVCLEALRTARKHNVTISGDINYRRNLWQYGKTALDVMPAFVEMTDIVVAGMADLENCLGIQSTAFEESCARTMKKFPNVKKIASTIRESINASHNRIEGTLYNGKQLLSTKVYDLTHIVDRVGSGDAFMAGLIYSYLNRKDDKHALDFGAACCAFKHSVPGDANLATVEEIEGLVRGENVGKLLR